MSKRKPNNNRARLERAERAAMRQSKLAIWHVERGDRQGLINWSTGTKYRATDLVLDAILERSHRWIIRLVALCQTKDGDRYVKVNQFEPDGIYRNTALAEVMHEEFANLKNSCNHNHVVGYAWLANPCAHWFSDDEAARIFDAVGAWPASEAAA